MACGQQTVKMTISITRLPNEKYGAISSSLDSILYLAKYLYKDLGVGIHLLKRSNYKALQSL